MQLIMYIILLNSQVLMHLKVFLVWKLVIWSTLVNLEQYVHFSNLVHTVLKTTLFLVSLKNMGMICLKKYLFSLIL